MNCRKVSEVVYRYVDNELESELRVEIREHLVLCPDCAREAALKRRFRALLRRSCAPTAAPARLRQRILTNLPHRREPSSWD